MFKVLWVWVIEALVQAVANGRPVLAVRCEVLAYDRSDAAAFAASQPVMLSGDSIGWQPLGVKVVAGRIAPDREREAAARRIAGEPGGAPLSEDWRRAGMHEGWAVVEGAK